MELKRFVKIGGYSFFGEYLYDRVVTQDHFLRLLKEGIDCLRFTNMLIKL